MTEREQVIADLKRVLAFDGNRADDARHLQDRRGNVLD
jgi:hypothetical protein